MNLPKIILLVAAGSGAPVLLLSAIQAEYALLFADGATVLSGVLYATSPAATNTTHTTAASATVKAANACVAVCFAMVCAFRISAQTTIVGALRTLWLIAVVTSSCGYTTIQNLSPRIAPAVPNDITIIAFAAGMLLILVSLVVIKCRGRESELPPRDCRVVSMEAFLLVGAFGIRYQTEFDQIMEMKTNAGWSLWYLCCHIATGVIVLLSSKWSTRSNDDIQLRIEGVAD